MSDEAIKQSPRMGQSAVAYGAHKILRFSFGLPRLAFGGALLSFIAGLGLTDVALDAFWPQHSNVGWIRFAGGATAFVIFLSAIKWGNRWTWPQVLVAIALFPVIFLLWGFGINWIFDPRPDPIRSLCLGLSPVIAFGGAAWILGRRFWPRRKHRA